MKADFDQGLKEISLELDYTGTPITMFTINYLLYHNQEVIQVCIFHGMETSP